MKRLSLVGSLGALAVLVGAASPAFACTCAPSDFYAAFASSDAVFLGEVLDVSNPNSGYPALVTVTMRIETAWKGEPASTTIHIVTSSSSASCGFPFRVGARYLVYSSRSGEAMGASLCSRTHETWADDPDLALLRSPLSNLHLTVSPNPSLAGARFAWTVLDDPGQVRHARLEILDFQGRRIRTLVDGPVSAGPHESFWNGRNENGKLSAKGVYWARLTYENRVTARRLVRLTTEP